MPDEKDELQIKIDEARTQLPAETRQAIDAVDWRAAIMDIRHKEGYDFIQLEELETETELLLCGLLNPEDYPKEIEKRMGISHEAAQKLLIDMNEKVFKRIREELIKITEKKPAIPTIPLPSQPAINITAEKGDLKNAGIEIFSFPPDYRVFLQGLVVNQRFNVTAGIKMDKIVFARQKLSLRPLARTRRPVNYDCLFGHIINIKYKFLSIKTWPGK